MGLDIFGLTRQEDRKRKEQEAMGFAKELIDQGASPEVVNQFVQNARSGKFELPTMQTQTLPGTADIPQRSTRVPFQFKSAMSKQEEQPGDFIFADPETGQETSRIPRRSRNDQVSFLKKQQEGAGDFVILDPSTGEMVGRVPRQKNDRAIMKPRPQASSAASADVQLAKQTITKGQELLKRGEEMTPEFRASFESAAEMLGIPLTQAELDPTFADKIRNAASGVTGGVVEPAAKRFGEGVPDFNRSGDAKRKRAIEWLRAKGAPVTDANIEAVIKKGL